MDVGHVLEMLANVSHTDHSSTVYLRLCKGSSLDWPQPVEDDRRCCNLFLNRAAKMIILHGLKHGEES